MEEQFKMPALLWLECFPEEIRNKAIYNCLSEGNEYQLYVERYSISDSIGSVFVWVQSNEGRAYWSSLFTFYGKYENRL